MTSLNLAPMYNLNVVLHETGLHADVLRAWERRYDLPKPERSAGGHRLYSEYDIAIIKWLREKQNEGLSISRAVDLWKQLIASGRDPLAAPAQRESYPVEAVETTSLDVLREAWLQACLAFDEPRAQLVLNQAFALAPMDTVCMEVLQRGIHEIGSLWQQARVTVQQEHFATAQAVQKLNSLMAVIPPPYRSETVLVACPAGEHHSFAALLMSLRLRWRGIRVIYLGANLPLDQMEQTAGEIRPDLILLQAQTLPAVPGLRNAADLFQRNGYRAAYGGLVFNRQPGLRALIPAEFLGESMNAAIDRIEDYLKTPAVSRQLEAEVQPPSELAVRVADRRSLIEARVMKLLDPAGLNADYMVEVNTYFSDFLLAALELGDLSYLEPELDWVNSLLAERKIPMNQMGPFLGQWKTALMHEIGPAAAPIAAWLEQHSQKS